MPNLDEQIAAVRRAWNDKKLGLGEKVRRDKRVKAREEADITALWEASLTIEAYRNVMERKRDEA